MKTLKIMAKNVTSRDHGPEEVHVVCDGCEFRTQIPRGLGQAFADSLGDTLQFARAQITERDDGTASLQLDTRLGDGTHVGPVAADFDEDFSTSDAARGFARYLGFTEATVVKTRETKRLGRDGKPRFAMLPALETI